MKNLEEVIISVTKGAEEVEAKFKWNGRRYVTSNGMKGKLVRCGECKHRPVKEDADGENYGFNLIKPNDGDERCPCLVSDGWYSWMPEDDFYCGYGERDSEKPNNSMERSRE